jgi:hypothetical protein
VRFSSTKQRRSHWKTYHRQYFSSKPSRLYYLHVEVTDAEVLKQMISQLAHQWDGTGTSAYLQTMASSCITLKWSPVMMSRHPVVVTKMLALGAASSIVVTS